jgi:hypothetical protein
MGGQKKLPLWPTYNQPSGAESFQAFRIQSRIKDLFSVVMSAGLKVEKYDFCQKFFLNFLVQELGENQSRLCILFTEATFAQGWNF